MKRGRFRWAIFVAGLALSLALHVFVVVPFVLAPMVAKPEAPLEVLLEPPSLAPSDESPVKPEPLDPVRAPELEKAPEPARLAEKKPEPARVEPPKPPEKPPEKTAQVKPVEPPKSRAQMVDQNRFEDEADNPDAHFLGQKNHRTQKETQARQTNLIREVEGKLQPATEPNDNQLPDVGAKRDQIAELENRVGPDQSLLRSAPRHGDEGRGTTGTESGPLSMRDLTPRSKSQSEKAREGLEMQESESGTLPMARVGQDAARAHAAKRGGAQVRLNLDHHLYDQIEGFDTAEKERRQAARAEVSHKAGRYEKYLSKVAAMRSSIENYLPPDVKPGNQTELGTRASPFAGYVTAMHRQIHKLFGDGFLADLEGRGFAKTAYDDPNLWTKLEIVVNADGTLNKRPTLVHTSGVSGFDEAAIDAVQNAAPFPVTPRAIRSANGRVYLHWQFHRNQDACGTFNVDPFILTSVAGEQAPDQGSAPTAAPRREGLRTLQRDPREVERMPPSSPPPEGGVEVTAEVRTAAEGWMAAYVRGDAAWLAGWSATPFVAAGEIVARDAPKLKAMYRQLLAEAPHARKMESLDLLTPAGMRARLGGLPPGGEDSGMLYAVGKAGSEEFILLLKKSTQGWRVAGMAR